MQPPKPHQPSATTKEVPVVSQPRATIKKELVALNASQPSPTTKEVPVSLQSLAPTEKEPVASNASQPSGSNALQTSATTNTELAASNAKQPSATTRKVQVAPQPLVPTKKEQVASNTSQPSASSRLAIVRILDGDDDEIDVPAKMTRKERRERNNVEAIGKTLAEHLDLKYHGKMGEAHKLTMDGEHMSAFYYHLVAGAENPCSKCNGVVTKRMAELSHAELKLFKAKQDESIPSKNKWHYEGFAESLRKLKAEEGVAQCGPGRPRKDDADSKVNVLDWVSRRRLGVYGPTKDAKKRCGPAKDAKKSFYFFCIFCKEQVDFVRDNSLHFAPW